MTRIGKIIVSWNEDGEGGRPQTDTVYVPAKCFYSGELMQSAFQEIREALLFGPLSEEWTTEQQEEWNSFHIVSVEYVAGDAPLFVGI